MGKNKIYLGINSVTNPLELCLVDRGGEVIDSVSWESLQNESETLLKNINQLLSQNEFTSDDLAGVVVISGPGSFVALRLGVVIANAFAQNIEGVKLYAINSFEFLSFELEVDRVILFAGGKEVYVYNPLDKAFGIEVVDSELEAKTMGMRLVVEAKNFEVSNDVNVVQKQKLEYVVSSLIKSGRINDYLVDNLPLAPNYVKEPSITINPPK
jgi:tRNA threonylcarbamoyl adenosine modification protein YeaZ